MVVDDGSSLWAFEALSISIHIMCPLWYILYTIKMCEAKNHHSEVIFSFFFLLAA